VTINDNDRRPDKKVKVDRTLHRGVNLGIKGSLSNIYYKYDPCFVKFSLERLYFISMNTYSMSKINNVLQSDKNRTLISFRFRVDSRMK